MNVKPWIGVMVAMLFCIQAPLAWAQKRIQTPAYSYKISSSYPYLKELPSWEEIPVLLEWISSDRKDAGVQVAYSQLVVISRADFGQPGHPISMWPPQAMHYQKTNCAQRWQQWWESVGKPYSKRLKTDGRQNLAGWKLVTRDNPRPLPESLVVIPDVWVLRTCYHAGDYGGKQTESITLRRDKNQATLIRCLRKSTAGALEWEEWGPLTIEQADTFAYAIAYAVDNPWLLETRRQPKLDGENLKSNPSGFPSRLEGRDLTLYYPWFQYHLADAKGNIWWNDAPKHWLTNENEYDTFHDAGTWLGVVCRLLWRAFPDAPAQQSPIPNAPGWKPVKLPNPTVLKQVTDDLELRDDLLDVPCWERRAHDALETLQACGTSDQVTAISRLESQLRTRMDQLNSLLNEDRNVSGMRLGIDHIIALTKKATTAIRQRAIEHRQ